MLSIFCQDMKLPALIGQFRQALDRQNHDMFNKYDGVDNFSGGRKWSIPGNVWM